MSDKEMSLKELMDSIRNTPFELEDPENPEYLDGSSAQEEAPPVDVDVCVNDTVDALKYLHLSQEEEQIVREFITFRWHARLLQNKKPEVQRAMYNLFIGSEEPDMVCQVADILRKGLHIPSSVSHYVREKDLLRTLSEARTSRVTGKKDPLFPMSTKFLVVYDCQYAPEMDMDGGAIARDNSRRDIALYHTMWTTILNFVKTLPETVLIVSSNESVFRNTLRPNNELTGRVCSHHLHLKPRTEEELLQDCLSELKRSSFTLADDFEAALGAYFRAAYRPSELTGQAFVSDLLCQIYSRYFCRRRDGDILTTDCIPVYDPLQHSATTVLGQLNNLVGLESAKEEFQNMYKMQVAGLATKGTTRYHMAFVGNPGTGKTTVARMAADLFFRMGIIKTNKLVAVKPSDLISEWIGGTGKKAMEVIRRAYNGVLFIDEAYGIATMDRGKELLNVLIQEMELHADKLVVILAGYTDEMRELMKANPGLGSRIGREIRFEDYTLEELVEIFLYRCKKDGFTLHPSARDELEDCIGALMTREFFGNARDVNNMLQDLKEAWSEEYYDAVTERGADNVTIEKVFYPQHFEKIMPPKKEISINDLIGLSTLKDKLEAFKRQAMYQKHLHEKGFNNLSDFSMHMIFTGNPGTGKTTVAKLIADDLYSIGMLKTNRLVVAERKDLISAYGDTAKKTADIIRKAVGGVLFIDEAYALADGRRSGLGNEAIEVFLTAMEEHKSDTVFIFAGYVDQMQEFLAMNPGIQSRIGYTFHFDDYSADELTQMFAERMHKTGFLVSPGALKKVRDLMEYFQSVKNFGNGRFVNHVIHQTISQRAARDFTTQYRNITARDIPSVKTLIDTAPNSMHLYDPAKLTKQEHRRTALHELGHAIVMVRTDPNNLPESISINNRAGSYGRVRLAEKTGNNTEQELMNYIATLLGGKNAEKVFLGSHSTGCASDYARAKRMADNMIRTYAMTGFGNTPKDILKAADKLSLDIITENKDLLLPLADILLKQRELSGKEFMKALKEKEQS